MSRRKKKHASNKVSYASAVEIKPEFDAWTFAKYLLVWSLALVWSITIPMLVGMYKGDGGNLTDNSDTYLLMSALIATSIAEYFVVEEKCSPLLITHIAMLAIGLIIYVAKETTTPVRHVMVGEFLFILASLVLCVLTYAKLSYKRKETRNA